MINMYAPAGKLKTPAPTILLMRLKTSFGIVAVPSVDNAASPSPPDISNAVLDHDSICCLLLEAVAAADVRGNFW